MGSYWSSGGTNGALKNPSKGESGKARPEKVISGYLTECYLHKIKLVVSKRLHFFVLFRRDKRIPIQLHNKRNTFSSSSSVMV